MNRKELEKLADRYHKYAMRASTKLQEALFNDLGETLLQNIESGKMELSEEAIPCVYNISLFYLLLKINGLYTYDLNSQTIREQYIKFAETMETKFWDIVEELNNFQPEGFGPNNNHDSQEEKDEQ